MVNTRRTRTRTRTGTTLTNGSFEPPTKGRKSRALKRDIKNEKPAEIKAPRRIITRAAKRKLETTRNEDAKGPCPPKAIKTQHSRRSRSRTPIPVEQAYRVGTRSCFKPTSFAANRAVTIVINYSRLDQFGDNVCITRCRRRNAGI
ncbi:unnamed protein product [Caenorhabditis bovis]|uniref:Uncharacterized protein n=1 Tax=Caenorhabditis bovis TaxID=2654633 RepID=A0A8S1EKQ3_9PELO|nr:unnamed protein product [Caenorhabditis bovis]